MKEEEIKSIADLTNHLRKDKLAPIFTIAINMNNRPEIISNLPKEQAVILLEEILQQLKDHLKNIN